MRCSGPGSCYCSKKCQFRTAAFFIPLPLLAAPSPPYLCLLNAPLPGRVGLWRRANQPAAGRATNTCQDGQQGVHAVFAWLWLEWLKKKCSCVDRAFATCVVGVCVLAWQRSGLNSRSHSVHLHLQDKNFTLVRVRGCISRVGQDRMYTPYMTVYLVNSLPQIPYIHRSGQPYVYPFKLCLQLQCWSLLGVSWTKSAQFLINSEVRQYALFPLSNRIYGTCTVPCGPK